RADEGGHARVLRRKRSLLVPHVKTDRLMAELEPAFVPFIERYPITSAVVVPLRSKDKFLGTLAAYRHEKNHPFTRADLLFLEELADRAVLGIENARLYREVHQAVQVRDDFLSVAGHELRTPLTALQLQLQALQRL